MPAEVITQKEFAERMKIKPESVKTVLFHNKWAKVKIKGIRQPRINWTKWEKHYFNG